MSNKRKSKWRYIWALLIGLLLLSSIPKIFTLSFMVEAMATSGVNNIKPTLIILGMIELGCGIIFLIPQTRDIGFLLATTYIGGIIATEWLKPTSNPLMGIALQTLIWTGMYFEKPAFFKVPAERVPSSD